MIQRTGLGTADNKSPLTGRGIKRGDAMTDITKSVACITCRILPKQFKLPQNPAPGIEVAQVFQGE